MNPKIQIGLSALAAIAAVIALTSWVDKHDQQLNAASEHYEACIFQQYGISPAHYRIDHGEYPTCDATKALETYYKSNPDDRTKIEALIMENPQLTDEEIMQIVQN